MRSKGRLKLKSQVGLMVLIDLKTTEDCTLKAKSDSQNNEARKILVRLTEKLSGIARSLESAVNDLKRLDDVLKEKSRKISRDE